MDVNLMYLLHAGNDTVSILVRRAGDMRWTGCRFVHCNHSTALAAAAAY